MVRNNIPINNPPVVADEERIMNVEKIVADLVQKIEHRFYGKYRGLVVDNADPEQLGRLKVKVPSVLGGDVVTGWAMPCTPYGGSANQGFLFIPEVDAGVWIEFEEGDLEFPIWVGTFWSKPGGDSELPKLKKDVGSDETGFQDPPTAKIIKTVAGHTIELEDADSKEMIRIVDGKNKHVITLDKDGIKIVGGANSGNKITMDNNGITIKSKIIKIGDSVSAEPLVLGTSLVDALNQWVTLKLAMHTHIGNLGAPTTLPIPQLLPPDLMSALSKKHKVE